MNKINNIKDKQQTEDTLKAPSLLFEIRRGIYKFLSTFFLNPPTGEVVKVFSDSRFLSELEEIVGDNVTSCFKEFNRRYNDNPDELEQEYRDLFRIPLGKYVTPYESVYRGGKKVGEEYVKGQLMGVHSLSVKKFYDMAGIDYSEAGELPDHIGLELEAMHVLCVREYDYRFAGNKEEADKMLQLQQKFMNEHIALWIDDLCQTIYEKTDSIFYKGVAMLTRKFIELDRNTLNGVRT